MRAQRSRTQNQAEQRSAEDAQHRACHCPDQPPQAQRTYAEFKDNDGPSRQASGKRSLPTIETEWVKEVTNNAEKDNKTHTKKNEIHITLPRWRQRKCAIPGTVVEYAHPPRQSSSGKMAYGPFRPFFGVFITLRVPRNGIHLAESRITSES